MELSVRYRRATETFSSAAKHSLASRGRELEKQISGIQHGKLVMVNT